MIYAKIINDWWDATLHCFHVLNKHERFKSDVYRSKFILGLVTNIPEFPAAKKRTVWTKRVKPSISAPKNKLSDQNVKPYFINKQCRIGKKMSRVNCFVLC
jgi:hypothetical protein